MASKTNIAGRLNEERSKSPRSVRRVAMDCLARREHSFFELKHKLQRKLPETSPDEILLVLETLREQNLQSDKRFVESFVRYRKSKGFGYLHIREDLRGRYVAENLISQFLTDDEDEWLPMVRELVNKRLANSCGVVYGSKEHQGLVRFLTSRGFQQSLTQQVLAPWICSSW